MKIESKKNSLLQKLALSLGSAAFAAAAFAQAPAEVESALADYADNVVVATYSKMGAAAVKLDKAVESLKKDPSDAKVAEAAGRWKEVRKQWELSESFLFGPAAFASLDPKLDSWPLDRVQLDAVLAQIDSGKLEIDAGYVRDYLGAALRGFHAVEYLLYRDGKPRKASDITKGQMAYLAAASRVIAEDCIALEAWWAGSGALSEEKAKYLEEAEIEVGKPYADEIKKAGKSGSRYGSQAEALEEIVQGCVDIVTELTESKIGGPAKSGDPKECESLYSLTSLEDCRDNILSVRASYEKISPVAAAKSPDADAKVKASIEKALGALDAFKKPLSRSLGDKDALNAAISACEELSEALAKAQELVSK